MTVTLKLNTLPLTYSHNNQQCNLFTVVFPASGSEDMLYWYLSHNVRKILHLKYINNCTEILKNICKAMLLVMKSTDLWSYQALTTLKRRIPPSLRNHPFQLHKVWSVIMIMSTSKLELKQMLLTMTLSCPVWKKV